MEWLAGCEQLCRHEVNDAGNNYDNPTNDEIKATAHRSTSRWYTESTNIPKKAISSRATGNHPVKS